jgi:putative ABC transport system permease protein
VNEALKEGGRTATAGGSRARLRKLLVISEVAMSLVLLIGAGLLMKSFVLLERVPPGFRPEKLLTMNVQLPRSRYPEPRKQAAFLDQALAGIAALPSVRSAGSVNALPMSGSQDALSFEIQDDPATPAEPRHAGDRSVNADYFRTMGMRIIKGRAFTARDADLAPKVAIVNESMARRFWPNQDPIGKRISTDYLPPVWREIVGVVEDVRHAGYDSDPAPEMYFPYSQHSQSSIDLVVRTETDPMPLASAVERAIWAVDKDQPVTRIKTMERMMADSVAPRRLTVVLIGIFASLALVLATGGIYGVISYTVGQRTHEIGVRMAMGARSVDVLKLVVGQGLRLVAVGVAAGLAGSIALTRVLARFLFGVTPTDPLTFAAVSVLLVTVALLASYIPARRASQVDPVNALRYE